jgi:hypothetical protein
MWVLNFDLCRDMPMDEVGAQQQLRLFSTTSHFIHVQQRKIHFGSSSENNIYGLVRIVLNTGS